MPAQNSSGHSDDRVPDATVVIIGDRLVKFVNPLNVVAPPADDSEATLEAECLVTKRRKATTGCAKSDKVCGGEDDVIEAKDGKEELSKSKEIPQRKSSNHSITSPRALI